MRQIQKTPYIIFLSMVFISCINDDESMDFVTQSDHKMEISIQHKNAQTNNLHEMSNYQVKKDTTKSGNPPIKDNDQNKQNINNHPLKRSVL